MIDLPRKQLKVLNGSPLSNYPLDVNQLYLNQSSAWDTIASRNALVPSDSDTAWVSVFYLESFIQQYPELFGTPLQFPQLVCKPASWEQ